MCLTCHRVPVPVHCAFAIAGPSRQLQQTINTGNTICPDGCLRPYTNWQTGLPDASAGPTDYCQQDATMGGLYCTRCMGSLVVKLVGAVCPSAMQLLGCSCDGE